MVKEATNELIVSDRMGDNFYTKTIDLITDIFDHLGHSCDNEPNSAVQSECMRICAHAKNHALNSFEMIYRDCKIDITHELLEDL